MTDRQGDDATGKRSRGLHWFAILLSCMTVTLLVAGALVTSNEAGDSVPDWPLSFGRWLIKSNNFVANVFVDWLPSATTEPIGLLLPHHGAAGGHLIVVARSRGPEQ